MKQLSHLCGLAAVFLICLLGCGGESMPELASIDDLGPETLEEGDVLWLSGQGFVEGPVDLVLDGTFSPSGLAEPWRRQVGLEAFATNPTRIELKATASVLARLTDEPVHFAGRIEARFPTAAGASLSVSAVLPSAHLELRPSGSAVPVVARRTRDAERYLEALGIILSSEGAREELVVVSVTPGSVAAKAGMASLDRLLGVDGETLSDLAELGGIDAKLGHTFDVVTAAGEVRQVRLRLRSRLSLETDETCALVLVSALLGAFFVLAAPRRRSPASEGYIWRWRSLAYLGVSAPVGLLPVVFDLDADRLGVLLALLALSVVALLSYEATCVATWGVRVSRMALRVCALFVSFFVVQFSTSRGLLHGPGSGAVVAAWLSPAHLAVLFLSMSLLFPSQEDSGGLRRVFAQLAVVPAAAASALLWLGSGSAGSLGVGDSTEPWIDGLTWVLATASLLVVGLALAPVIDDRRRQRRAWTAVASRLGGLIASTAAALVLVGLALPTDVRAFAEVAAMTLFFAVVAAAILREVQRPPASTRERISRAMEGGTSPVISPP